jgi:hypothetical protein
MPKPLSRPFFALQALPSIPEEKAILPWRICINVIPFMLSLSFFFSFCCRWSFFCLVYEIIQMFDEMALVEL